MKNIYDIAKKIKPSSKKTKEKPKKDEKNLEEKGIFYRWLALNFIFFATVLVLMIISGLFIGDNAKKILSGQNNILDRAINQIKNSIQSGKKETKPSTIGASDSPSILFDHFFIKSEPDLNSQGTFRLFDYNEDPLDVSITAPPTYSNVEVNHKLFWVDVIVNENNFWMLMSSVPEITVENDKYFELNGNQLTTVPVITIDNTLNNRGVLAKVNNVGFSINNDIDKINTLTPGGDALEIVGVDLDFGFFSNNINRFNLFVSLYSGSLRRGSIEGVEVLDSNKISSNDNQIVFDVIFRGGKQALTYGSNFASSFTFKTRLEINKVNVNTDGTATYSVKQLTLPKNAISSSTQFAWNFPLTLQTITIFPKVDNNNNLVYLKDVYTAGPASGIVGTLTVSANKSEMLFSFPKYYSASNRNGIIRITNTRVPTTSYKQTGIVNISGSSVTIDDAFLRNNIDKIIITFSERGVYTDVEIIRKGISYDSADKTFSLKSNLNKRFWMKLENLGTANASLRFAYIGLPYDPQDVRVVSMKFLLKNP